MYHIFTLHHVAVIVNTFFTKGQSKFYLLCILIKVDSEKKRPLFLFVNFAVQKRACLCCSFYCILICILAVKPGSCSEQLCGKMSPAVPVFTFIHPRPICKGPIEYGILPPLLYRLFNCYPLSISWILLSLSCYLNTDGTSSFINTTNNKHSVYAN